MEITQEQFELLREFDAANCCVGTKVIYADFNKGEICSPLNRLNEFIVNYEEDGYIVHAKCTEKNLRLLPMTWLEGKPVYKGDTLYYKGSDIALLKQGTSLIIIDTRLPNFAVLIDAGGFQRIIPFDALSWKNIQVPIVHTRWINCYPNGFTAHHKSKEEADSQAEADRCDCICIHWIVK